MRIRTGSGIYDEINYCIKEVVESLDTKKLYTLINTTYVDVKNLQDLNKQANLRWCAEVLEKEIEKHHQPASNMRSIARHLVYQLGLLENAIDEEGKE